MKFNPLNISDIIRETIDLQKQADERGVKCDTLSMQQAFYFQDKVTHGSFKLYIGTPAYEKMMYGRYMRIFSQIRKTIDAKAQFQFRNDDLENEITKNYDKYQR